MKRTILALGIAVAFISGPVFAACDSCHGAQDGTSEVTGFIVNTINPTVSSGNLAQPSRRDVAGAVELDLELNSSPGLVAKDMKELELTRTVDENGAKLNKE